MFDCGFTIVGENLAFLTKYRVSVYECERHQTRYNLI